MIARSRQPRLALRRAGWLAFASLLEGTACGERYDPLSDEQIQKAISTQSALDVAELHDLVGQIYEARLSDPEKDTSRSEHCGGGGDCVYSRVATADLIRNYWSSIELAGAEPHEHVVDADAFTTHNLFLDIPGRTHPDEWVLATAHYDAWFGGANDNATGVAVVLAATRALLAAALDRSVRLILFDGEELGMVGAGRYVSDYGTDGVVLALNADSVAFVGATGSFLTRQPSDIEYIVQANEPSAELAYQLTDLARRLPRPLAMRPLVFPGDGVSLAGVVIGYDRSDHAQFWLDGARALFPFPAGDKPDWYHTAGDTPEQVDADRLERFGRLWVAALAAFASVRP